MVEGRYYKRDYVEFEYYCSRRSIRYANYTDTMNVQQMASARKQHERLHVFVCVYIFFKSI